jgi:hypothetical protein
MIKVSSFNYAILFYWIGFSYYLYLYEHRYEITLIIGQRIARGGA